MQLKWKEKTGGGGGGGGEGGDKGNVKHEPPETTNYANIWAVSGLALLFET